MTDALELMLALQRAPGLAARLRTRGLPEDVLQVIRLAAGDERASDEAAAATGLDAQPLREAAALYLQETLFCEGADSYRTLGVLAHADTRQIKEHHRWLIHWLHPDREGGGELSMFAERVNRAWNDLRTPDRRQAYNLQQGHVVSLDPAAHPAALAMAGAPARRTAVTASDPLLPGRVVRRLPQLVLGGFAGMAMLVVGGLIALHDDEQVALVPMELSTPAGAAAVARDTVSNPAPARAAVVAPAAASGPLVAAHASSVVATSLPPSAARLADGTPPPIGADRGRAPMLPAIAAAPPRADRRVGAASDLGAAAALTSAAAATRAPTSVTESAPPVSTRLRSVRATPPAAPTSKRASTAAPASTDAGTGAATVAAPTPTAPAVAGGAGPHEDAPALVAVTTKDAPAGAVPAFVAQPAPGARGPGSDLPAPAQVQSTIERMQDAYRKGDLDALMSLFVSEPGGRPRAVLAREYGGLFADSNARALVLKDLVWLTDYDTMVGLGRFEASVTSRRGGQPRVTQGGVRVELRMEQGEARIARMSHERQ